MVADSTQKLLGPQSSTLCVLLLFTIYIIKVRVIILGHFWSYQIILLPTNHLTPEMRGINPILKVRSYLTFDIALKCLLGGFNLTFHLF